MKFALLIFICALFASCFNPGDCLINATNYVHLQFRKQSNIALDSAVALTRVYYLEANLYLKFPADTTLSEMLLPVDTKNNSTTFVLQRTSLLDTTSRSSDTLQIQYNTQSKIISPACGAFTYYQNLKILKTSLKSTQIKIVNTNLIKDPTNSDISAYAVNYQIYY